MVKQSSAPVILTIDDEEVVRLSIKAFLEDYEYQVFEANNGRLGLEIYEEEDIDLILVDLRMPEMDGLQVLSAIREKDQDIPVIVVSGTGNIADVVDALRLGAWDYLLKPIDDMTILRHAVEKGLERSSLLKENKSYQIHLEDKVAQKTEELGVVNNRLREVVETTKNLLGCGELYESGSRLLQEFGKHMNAHGGSIYQVTEDGLQRVGTFAEEQPYDFIPFPLDNHSVYAKAIETKEPFFVTDIFQETLLRPSGGEHYANPSCIVFPILKQTGEVRAIISLHDKVHPPFHNQDKEIGSILMSYSAEALETAQAVSALKQSEEFLMQAQKMEAIGTLAGGIAHDFNNILSAIVGYTDLSLYSKNCDEATTKNLEQIKKASDRARDLVGQILAFSRSPDGQQEKPLDLGPVLREALKLLRATIPSSITIKKNIPTGLGKVTADSTRIHQIIMNLCTNAVHALQKKDGTITIEYAAFQKSIAPHDLNGMEASSCVRITVKDTGRGMSKAVLDRIFDPYFTTKDQGEGTGLGLAVVHGIVSTSGGLIRVDSKPGQGTSFHIYFPCTESNGKNETNEANVTLLRGSERILFVDDEATLGEMVRQMLESLGYKVTVLTSSIEALNVFKSEPDTFDLLITDQTMPMLSGLELAQHVLEVKHDLPVILYTGYSAAINGREARRLGIREFMMKPLSMTSLSTTVRKVLDSGN